MRVKPIRPAPGGSAPSQPRVRGPLRAAFSVAFAAAIGFVPAIVIAASPAQAAAGDYSIIDVETVEADLFVFDVTREAGGVGAESVSIDTVAGTAIESPAAHADYTGVHITLNYADNEFGSSDQIKRVTVHGLADAWDENDETFNLTATVGGVLKATGHAVMDDDDATPTYTLSSNGPRLESAGTATVTATLSEATGSGKSVTIPIATADDTAVQPGDYTAFTGSIVIPPYTATGTQTVAINNDTTDEEDTETFTVDNSGASTNASDSAVAPISVGITDNDAAPTISFGDAGAVAEGTNSTFTATLSAASERTITATINTSDGVTNTATANTDYTPTVSGTLTFVPLDTSEDFTVATTDDALDEVSPETFTATLSAPVHATISGPASRVGSINDNDTAPTVTLAPNPDPIVEGSTGASTNKSFDVTLSAASGQPVTVHWAATGDTATAGADFTAASGDVTFNPGDPLTKSFTVAVFGDVVDEPTENFNLTLSNSGGTVGGGGALTTNSIPITDDDATPTYSVADVSQAEGNVDGTATFVVTLNRPSSSAATFDVAIVDGTLTDVGAGAGSNDYDAPSTTVTIPATTPGGTSSLSSNIVVVTHGDVIYEGNETATLTVTRGGAGAANSAGGPDVSTLTLINDDAKPVITLNTESGSEGTSVEVNATVVGRSQADMVFDLTYSGDSTGDNNPAESSDYDGSVVTATIPSSTLSGATVNLRTFRLEQDTIDEPVEAVKVEVADHAGIVDTKSSIYKISDDPGDIPPAVSIGDLVVGEADGTAHVPVTLTYDSSGDTTATERDITVNYATTNATAVAPGDFTATSGSLVF
jgi:hypothetical protein